MEAVPHIIKNIYIEADYQKRKQCNRENFSTPGYFSCCKEYYAEEDCRHTASYVRQIFLCGRLNKIERLRKYLRPCIVHTPVRWECVVGAVC